MEEGGGNTSTFPFEIWHYRYLEGIGDNIDIEFVDTCMCGDYHMTIDRSEKDALKHTFREPARRCTSRWAWRSSRTGIERRSGAAGHRADVAAATRASSSIAWIHYAKLMAPPEIKFKDMESFMTTSKILTGPPFLFDVRTDYVKVTNDTILVPVTLQIRNSDITFNNKDGVAMGTVNILGRVSNLNHKPIQTFEDTVSVQVPSELLARKRERSVGVLEVVAASARPLQDRYCDQGRQQSGPYRQVAAQLECSEV